MKKHLFRIIAVLSAAVLLAGCAASRLRLGAAAAGGVYNAFGTAMSAQNSTIEVKQTAGSAANLRLLAGGYLQLAVAQSDMAQDAYNSSGIFAHESTERSFSAVAALYEEAVQVVVRADSGITTLEELQGCTLSVGEEESGTEQNAGQVLAA
ncbi:MAG TPA: TAXI family TRAP transporter solute-binding subunit, partial [Gemmiger formicilis]|nr:TAXI family TRAP transporter solute-binding subunit [Gemmiger formicilis]